MTNALKCCLTFALLFVGAFVTGIFIWHKPTDSPPEVFWFFLAVCVALATVFGILHLWAYWSDEHHD